MREYVLYCDESNSAGKYYGNFYGGVLVESVNLDRCIQQPLQRKEDLNLYSEVSADYRTVSGEISFIDGTVLRSD